MEVLPEDVAIGARATTSSPSRSGAHEEHCVQSDRGSARVTNFGDKVFTRAISSNLSSPNDENDKGDDVNDDRNAGGHEQQHFKTNHACSDDASDLQKEKITMHSLSSPPLPAVAMAATPLTDAVEGIQCNFLEDYIDDNNANGSSAINLNDYHSSFRKLDLNLASNFPPPSDLWEERSINAVAEIQQRHSNIIMHLVERGYSPIYAQILATTMVNAQLSNNNVDLVPNSQHRGIPYIWNGELPPRNYSNPVFSTKVFVGGVPWDITESALLEAFSKYGPCRVEWPGRELHNTHTTAARRAKVTGYVYMIFDSDWAVKKLLQDCSQEFGTAGEWYFKLSARRANTTEIRQVQVIPWVTSDASYFADESFQPDPKKTVFVGALHGMITAQVLSSIMKDVYGDVLFVGIDTDRHKYPIGSARVSFLTPSAYFRAIESGYLEIKTSKFVKKVQIDPFLEDTKCSQCELAPGPYFCREKNCFKYFCLQCWEIRHTFTGLYGGHKPMIRTSRRAMRSSAYFTYNHDNLSSNALDLAKAKKGTVDEVAACFEDRTNQATKQESPRRANGIAVMKQRQVINERGGQLSHKTCGTYSGSSGGRVKSRNSTVMHKTGYDNNSSAMLSLSNSGSPRTISAMIANNENISSST